MELQTRGWQSQRFWTYPQEIIVGFPCSVHLKSIQIVFHEIKLPSRVELLQIDNFDDNLFGNSSKKISLDFSQHPSNLLKRPIKPSESKSPIKEEDQALSQKKNEEYYMKENEIDQSPSKKLENQNIRQSIQKGEEFDSNLHEESKFIQDQSKIEDDGTQIGIFELQEEFSQRQLKSISIDKEVKYLKLKWYQNHQHKLNVFNQIGIINIAWFGTIVGYENEYISGLKNINPSEAILIDMMLHKKISDSNENASSGHYSMMHSASAQRAIASTLDIFDDKISALNTSKTKAVDQENYTEAEKLKQIIMKIEKIKEVCWEIRVTKTRGCKYWELRSSKKIEKWN